MFCVASDICITLVLVVALSRVKSEFTDTGVIPLAIALLAWDAEAVTSSTEHHSSSHVSLRQERFPHRWNRRHCPHHLVSAGRSVL